MRVRAVSQFSDKRCELNEKGRIPKELSQKGNNFINQKLLTKEGGGSLYSRAPKRKESKTNPNLVILNID